MSEEGYEVNQYPIVSSKERAPDEVLDFTALLPRNVTKQASVAELTEVELQLKASIAAVQMEIQNLRSGQEGTLESFETTSETVAQTAAASWANTTGLMDAVDRLDELKIEAQTLRDEAIVVSGLASDASQAATEAFNKAVEAQNSADRAITASVIEYAVGPSDTSPPTSGWEESTPTPEVGSFIWFRTKITRVDNTTDTTIPSLLVDSESTGVSVTAIIPHFMQHPSGSGTPTSPAPPNGAGWEINPPPYMEGTSLWRSEKVTYSDGSVTFTSPIKDAAYEVAAKAVVSANGKNSRYTSISDPGTSTINPDTSLPFVVSDTWWKVDSLEARNSTGQWSYMGDGVWKSEFIKSEVIANLDTNKLTAGSAVMDIAVAKKLVSDFSFHKVLTAETIAVLSSDGGLYLDPTFEDGGISTVRAFNNVGYTYNTVTRSMDGTGNFFLSQKGIDEGASIPLIQNELYTIRVWATNMSAATGYALAIKSGSGAGSVSLLPTTDIAGGGLSAVVSPTLAGNRVFIQRVSGTATVAINRVEIRKGIGGTLIENGAITTDKLDAFAVTAAKIAANTITADQIAAKTITAGQIKAAAITGDLINARTIKADNIIVGSITYNEIKNNTITNNEIQNNTITGNEIYPNTITSSEINVQSIQAAVVTAESISGKVITGATLQTSTSGTRFVLGPSGGNAHKLIAFDDGNVERISFGLYDVGSEQNATLRLASQQVLLGGQYTNNVTTIDAKVGLSLRRNTGGTQTTALISLSSTTLDIVSDGSVKIQAASGKRLDLNGSVYLNGSLLTSGAASQVFDDQVASGTTIAANGLLTVYVSMSGLSGVPRAIIPVMTSSPGGSASWVPRVAGWNSTTATIRFYNSGSTSSTLNGSLTFNITAVL